MHAHEFLHKLSRRAQDYKAFNLLVFDGCHLMGLESRGERIISLPTGIGAVSNADFQTPWPKVTRLKKGLQEWLAGPATDTGELMKLLHDRALASDPELPQTGIPLASERVLSAPFIAGAAYGTRACSVVRIHREHAEFTEESFGAGGALGAVDLKFALRP